MKRLLLLLFLTGQALHSQEILPEKIIQNFFVLYTERGSDNAIDYLFSNNPAIYSRADSVHSLKKTFQNIEKFIGPYKSYRIAYFQNVEDILQVFIVIVRFEKQPLRYLFVFYKPENKWITYRFEIDTKYPDNFVDRILREHNFEN